MVWRISADQKTVAFPPPASTRYTGGASAGKHVLIIDHDPNFRGLFKVMLAQSGFPLAPVREAEEAATAVAFCRDDHRGGQLDLVFCDLNLSRVWPRNGIGTVYDIRRLRPELPVYMVTADNTSEVIEQVCRAGATGHILKPLNLRVLRRVLTATFPFGSYQL
jgi:CheY-like chemotaxis protein